MSYLTVIGVFRRMRKQQEEERLQRRVQEEAVKFLWKQVRVTMRNTDNVLAVKPRVVFVFQLQVVLEWQSSVNERLRSETPVRTEMSIPESGLERPAALDNSLSSTVCSPGLLRAGVGNSLSSTVCSPGPLRAGAGDSLLEQYLSSVQGRDEEEEEDEAASHLSS